MTDQLSAPSGFAAMHGSAFEPRKSWVLVGPSRRVVHLSDNKKILQALARKGDEILRAQIVPLEKTDHENT